MGNLRRWIRHPLARYRRRFEHRRFASGSACGEGGLKVGANSISTRNKLLTTGNADNESEKALFEKLGLKAMEVVEPIRASKMDDLA